jgi:methionyl aminopeptidase
MALEPIYLYRRLLEDGDIINIDVTVFLNGYHGDTSQTFLVGDVDEPGQDLVRVTNEALQRAIAACGPGKPFRDIGKAIHDFLKDKHYSVSAQFTGHGINSVFHCAPWIHHTRTLFSKAQA